MAREAKKIEVLDKKVAELIAAGEVVDRPASVAKELLENAVDAGAAAITLEIKNGGVSYLRVSDDGCGIGREDVRTAFLRHATSKVRREEDLAAIGTLGFRGEALASVSAVARVELVTKTQDSFAGTVIRMEGGEESFFGEMAAGQGTTVIVRDLFYNTPARMKFLKKDAAEGSAVMGVADRIALSHPEISLRCIEDGKEQLFTPGDSKLLSAVYAVYGREFAQGLLEVQGEAGGIRVFGYVSHPDCSRGNRSMQNFYVNGRYVRSATCMAALAESYRNLIMAGRFPACVLFLEMPPGLVDVNVHPAKIEVRFANEKPVFDAVYFAVKNALMPPQGPQPVLEAGGRPAFTPGMQIRMSAEEYRSAVGSGNPSRFVWGKAPAPFPEKYGFGEERPRASLPDFRVSPDTLSLGSSSPEYSLLPKRPQAPPGDERGERDERRYQYLFKEKKNPSLEETSGLPESRPLSGRSLSADKAEGEIQVIGEAFSTYIIAVQGEKLLLIDKHAAHERYLFNKLISQENAGHCQSVLPFPVPFSAEDHAVLWENRERLKECGFTFEDLGGKTLMVHSVPMYLDLPQTAATLSEIAGKLREGRDNLDSDKLTWIYESVACRSAIKAGDVNDVRELEAMVELLRQNGEITHCPHGRPITVELSRYAIEKLFGRKQ